VNLGVTSDYVATGSRGTLGHWNESWPSSCSSIGVMDTCHSCWALPVEVVDEESVALHTTSATAKIRFWAFGLALTHLTDGFRSRIRHFDEWEDRTCPRCPGTSVRYVVNSHTAVASVTSKSRDSEDQWQRFARPLPCDRWVRRGSHWRLARATRKSAGKGQKSARQRSVACLQSRVAFRRSHDREGGLKGICRAFELDCDLKDAARQ